jgi:hypothetical protein
LGKLLLTSTMHKPVSAWLFAVAICALYVAAILPALQRHSFDVSAFVVAGDKYVNASQLPGPVYVRANSSGYDGQFYYRLALAPLDGRDPLYGVTMDDPAYRTQRIAYPLLAWAASFGHPRLVPLALVVVNLIGIAAVALFAVRLTRRLALPPLVPFAIALWPGFLVTLTHDTTEIVFAAFMLAALDQYFAGRLWLFAILGAVATLARETGELILGGLFLYELVVCRQWKRAAICALALLLFVAWREAQIELLGVRNLGTGAGVVTWPLAGVAGALTSMVAGDYVTVPGFKGAVIRGFAVVSALSLVAFCALVVSRISTGTKALAAAWLPILALMSILSAEGPWVEPIAFLRTFTECWIVGCLLLDDRFAQSRFARPAFAVLLVIWVGAGWLSTTTIT